ncbi:lysophospholipid acyltransferase family protein [Thalassospira sp. ER-Se-21-Dark]|uniref:lysophospholipid acyltransferase family protein n=1 Tax=Thalassospira sp. ER-Se-21-Dark TaxID=2585190 RepID=UPI001B3004D5|nr:lysophospholipid acyltransferase family protein [Thalassospira sp. ER-Se-21-Dark]MBP3126505.1 1-acyl-sn-glycerol-3-phosphate acyltransferase [Thalassospira sp. ER-Se-21-Dark]
MPDKIAQRPIPPRKGTQKGFNWYWRLFATGFAFASFGLGGLFMALTIFPAMMLVLQDREKRRRYAQLVICRGFRLFAGMLDVIGVASVETENMAQLRTANGSIIIANHPTLLDVVMILAQLDKCQCVVKHQLFRNPFLFGVVRAAGFIRNDDNPEHLIKQAKHHLSDGACILIFPEGTRTPSNQTLGKFQRGVANIAIETQADLIPVVVHCNHDTLKKGVRWYRIAPSKIRYRIVVDKPLAFGDLHDPELSRAKQARYVTRFIRDYFVDRLKNDRAGKRT